MESDTTYLIPVYLTYAVVSIGLTVILARVLYRNGAVFLRDVFADSEGMAEAVNNLLVVGFFMLTLGVSFMMLRTGEDLSTATAAVEVLVSKLGILMLTLGTIHFFNVFVFHRIRRRNEYDTFLPPPVPPHASTLPPPPTTMHGV
jgi:hypothetical protein